MTRLAAEWHRLFVPPGAEAQGLVPDAARLISPDGRVRAMVLELAGPGDWPRLSAVWQGVQTDLEWPAPAIAVNGQDGHQLWFPLTEPVPAAQAAACLDALRRQHLADLRADRVRLFPSAPPSEPASFRHARPVPAQWAQTHQWSAFVMPGLAPVFADDPWLDTMPSVDAQAELLSRIRPISPAEFLRAMACLAPTLQPASPPKPSESGRSEPRATAPTQTTDLADASQDAKRFLLRVMNDPAVEMALRIEAAKALLPSPGPSGV